LFAGETYTLRANAAPILNRRLKAEKIQVCVIPQRAGN